MMKRVMTLALVCVMLLTLLCACGGADLAALQEDLCSGMWLAHEQDSQEQAQALLESIDLYPEEIELADLDSLKFAVILEFQSDGTYTQTFSVEHTKPHIRAFYEGVFAALFENRAALDSVYNDDLSAMDEAQFQSYYAGMYGYEDFSELLNEFVEGAYERDEELEAGTYTLKSAKLIYIQRTNADPEAESNGTLPFQLEGDTLTLEYSDGDSVYTRIG